ncbi:MAG: MMPL family transporter [Deltaproteobacteria bacterium]|nr:MMPL family transporter [Deltaproteobacteria bacterium]
MRERLLRHLADAVIAAPRRVIVAALILGTLAIWPASGLEVQAGHQALFDQDAPQWKRFRGFMEEFGSPDLLFALVEGGDAALRRRVLGRLADELPGPKGEGAGCRLDGPPKAEACVKDVLARVDFAALRVYAPLFLPPEALSQLVHQLSQDAGLSLARLQRITSLGDLFLAVAEEVERRGEEAEPTGEALKTAQKAMAMVARVIDALSTRTADTHAAQRPFLEAVVQAVGEGAKEWTSRGGLDAQGYFVSKDKHMHLAIIRPHNGSDDPNVVVPFVQYVQATVDRVVQQESKGVGNKAGREPLRVRLTGLPALIHAEKITLSRDLKLTSTVAALGVLAIFMFGFRSLRQGLLGFIPLAVSLIATLAVVRFTYGGLNLATSAFLPTALGLGIDFSIHLLSRFNEARYAGRNAQEAARDALLGAGPGMVTGGLTTAAAFAAMAASEFQGFVELGVITAISVLFALLLALTMGTALLSHPKLAWFQVPPPQRHAGAGAGIANFVQGRRVLLVGFGLLITALMIWRGQSIQWSHNYLDLLPAQAPAVEAMVDLAQRTDYSGEVAAMRAENLVQARAKAKRVAALSTVGRVESLANYLPEDQPRKLALLRKLKPLFAAPGSRPASMPTGLDVNALGAGVQQLLDNLQDARFEAKSAKKSAAQALLDAPIVALKRFMGALKDTPQAQVRARLAPLQDQALKLLREGLSALDQASKGGELTAEKMVAALPPALGERLYHQGSFALYIYPSRWVWEPGFLPRFVDQLQSIDPEATGWPVTHWTASLIIKRGFHTAAMVTSVVLLLFLFGDFRSVRYTLLAAFPVLVGLSWTWGAIGVMGMSYNFANIIGFPLVIGIGVASGVHILHRFRQEGEHDVAPVVRQTGLAVLLSALTTMVGFGSLVLANHRGASSLGVVLLVGVGCCLLTATVLLPALLAILRRR